MNLLELQAALDGTPGWAYDEDGYCVCCGAGHWKYHRPECELRDSLEATKKWVEVEKALAANMYIEDQMEWISRIRDTQ